MLLSIPLLSVSSSYKAFMMERKSDGKIGIRLYLKIISKQFCLNEELVNKGYATFSSESEETEEGERKLILNAPITKKVVCFSSLLKCLRSLYGKQCGPRSDCSYRSCLFWVYTDCFFT